MRRPFHPIALAVYPVLFLYSQNSDITPFGVALWPMLFALAGGAAVWGIAWLAWKRNASKSALIASVFVFFFYAFGHVHTFIHKWVLDMGFYFGKKEHAEFILKGRISLGLSFICLVLLALAIWKLRQARPQIVSALTLAGNVMALVLLAMPTLTLAAGSFTGDAESAPVARAAEEEVHAETRVGYRPDVYNIVLDGYGRKDILEEFYEFDNHEFLGFLEETGFFIAPKSRANYNWTILSLASYLNMKYVNSLTEEVGADSRNRARPFVMTRDNEVARFLRGRGYRFVHLQSSWGSTVMNPYADEQISCRGGVFQEDFYRVLMESSLLKVWEPSVGVGLAECHLNNLATLEQIGPAPGPKLVFVHFVPPHHPYVFDREGNILRQATVSNQFEWRKRLWGDRDLYLDQMHFMNQRIRAVIQAILATSEQPPVIVLHSDHGPQILEGEGRTEGEHYERARYANLATFYLPGLDDNPIPDDVTLVNVYRFILNAYFDAGYEILDDRFYRSEYLRPYDFRELSDP